MYYPNSKRYTLSLPPAIIIGFFFANNIDADETDHNEPSHLDLCCLTFILSTLYINFFPSDSLLKKKKKRKKKKADDKVRLEFGIERVKCFLYNPFFSPIGFQINL